MVTANLVRQLPAESVVYIIAPDLRGVGLAYGTTNLQHLLNVPAHKMGAFADDSEGFYRWLGTSEAALAKRQLGLDVSYQPTDFAPRMLFGAYLESVWQDTQSEAARRRVYLKLVESKATNITVEHGLAVATARGDAIAVDDLVLASGNETKPILRDIVSDKIVQNPWAPDAFSQAAEWASPVMLMGAGLTAIDTVLSLRAAEYRGEIIMFSRHGWMPEAHAEIRQPFVWNQASFDNKPTLSELLRLVRRAIVSHGEWRPVTDGLRPHTQRLWQRLNARQQKRFLARLLTLWNVHRHRMAPQIAQRMQQEMTEETLRLIAGKHYRVRLEDEQLRVEYEGAHGLTTLSPSYIINCTGPQLQVAKSAQAVMIQALAEGVIEPHATGLGAATDPALRAWGLAYPHLYVIGGLATGQLLESTAVPELRMQAADIAKRLAKVYDSHHPTSE